MKSENQKDIGKLLEEGAVLNALRIGSKRAVRMHKLMGYPVATSRNGKVVWIPPEEIQVDEPKSQ